MLLGLSFHNKLVEIGQLLLDEFVVDGLGGMNTGWYGVWRGGEGSIRHDFPLGEE